MSYTLAAAAMATGSSKKALLRAIKDGTIIGTKDKRGEWCIEPAELHRVYPPMAQSGDARGQPAVTDVDALGAQIEALLRQAGERLRRQLDDVRHEREGGHPARHERAIERSDA